MKQTAVEWLMQQLENHNGVTRTEFENVIKQAKEMEKQQIIEAHGNQTKKASPLSTYILTGERYYNETFKK